MKNSAKLALLGSIVFAGAVPVWAYKQTTHSALAEYAALQSSLNQPSTGILYGLGLGDSVTDRRQNFLLPATFPWGFNVGVTPLDLIARGAVEEDLGTRAINHFFDAQQGGAALPTGHPSPDWALEDKGRVSGQDYSYEDAKRTLYSALTAPSRLQRGRELALMFESLGHVIHHLQDMSQPQHVRGDDHCDDTPFYLFFVYFPNGCATLPVNIVLYRPSGYEAYVSEHLRPLPLAGYAVPDYATFDLPRKFWVNGGRGNAEFTSNNFVSIGTNFRGNLDEMEADPEHPLPAPPGRPGVTVENIENLLGPVGPGQPLHGTIWFLSTPVQDAYDPTRSTVNPRTSSFSLFENDLRGFGVQTRFSMNRFNYQSAAKLLIPRAAGYSVAMLNYFFRGRIEITPPAGEVYSVIDHAKTNAVGPALTQGFSKVKMRLRNSTLPGVPPGGSPLQGEQEMAGGSLVAIATYIPNPCYTPDLLGEYNGTDDFGGVITRNGCTLAEYFGGVEKIAVSAALSGQSLSRTEAREVTFDFSQQPIPINSHDLSIQVVYRGALGSEQDAIAVSASNLAEPTYVSLINGSDYFGIDSTLYTPEDVSNDESLRSRVQGININPEALVDVTFKFAGVPVAGPGVLPAKGHHRIAILMDAETRPPLIEPKGVALEISSAFVSFPLQSSLLQVMPILNQLAREPSVISEISIERRGLSSWLSLYRFKQLASATISAEEVDSKPPMDPSCFDGANYHCVPDPTPIPILFE